MPLEGLLREGPLALPNQALPVLSLAWTVQSLSLAVAAAEMLREVMIGEVEIVVVMLVTPSMMLVEVTAESSGRGCCTTEKLAEGLRVQVAEPVLVPSTSPQPAPARHRTMISMSHAVVRNRREAFIREILAMPVNKLKVSSWWVGWWAIGGGYAGPGCRHGAGQ